jgi:hypothetical protein
MIEDMYSPFIYLEKSISIVFLLEKIEILSCCRGRKSYHFIASLHLNLEAKKLRKQQCIRIKGPIKSSGHKEDNFFFSIRMSFVTISISLLVHERRIKRDKNCNIFATSSRSRNTTT